jgi:L-asparaginase
VVSILRKDSLDLTDQDRQMIHDQALAGKENRILITHGTDTMVKTAEKLKDIADKTIVLTGALEPALFKTSDALFNIGCGLAAVQSLESGVYIVMSGRVFSWDNVHKNLKTNRFETINNE